MCTYIYIYIYICMYTYIYIYISRLPPHRGPRDVRVLPQPLRVHLAIGNNDNNDNNSNNSK